MALTDWQADGSALSDHADFIRVLNPGSHGLRGRNTEIPNRHGEWSTPKFYPGADFLLEVGVKSDTGYAHLSILERLLGNPTGVRIQTAFPNAGTVFADAELLGAPNPTQSRFVYTFPMRVPKGVWESTTVSASSGGTVTVGGDRPVGDMVVTFASAGSATLVAARGTAVLGWAGSGTAVVDCGARTVTKAGVNQDSDFSVSQPWWWEFVPGESNVVSGASVTIHWRNKWAAG